MSAIPRILLRTCCKKKFLNAASIVAARGHSSGGEGFVKCAYPDVDIPRVHITEYLMDDMAKWHDKIALECGLTGRKYTYDEIRMKSRNLGKSLRKKMKLQNRDVVALILPNIPEFTICMLGVFLAGFRITTINPSYTPEEIERQLADCDAKLVIVVNETWNNAKAAANRMKKDLDILVVKTEINQTIPRGAINFQEFLDETVDVPDADLSQAVDDVLFLPYSSGTTGRPKGVNITNLNLVSNVAQSNSPDFKLTVDATETHQDVTLAVLPFFHIYGFVTVQMNFLKAGGKLVTLPKFTKETYLSALVEHKPSLVMVVPPIVIFLNTHAEVKPSHLENLRTVFSGAAPLGILDEEKLKAKVGRPLNLVQGYGLTEASPGALFIPIDKVGKYPGSVGHPLPNTTVKIVDHNDPEGKHLEVNQIGEVLLKGPQVTKGYHNRPEETDASFLDGWLRTGDLAYYDKDGMFYITDRIKELIKVKGFQVAPAELEEIIRDYPGVAEAAVVGIPDEYSGEIPRAYVVAKADAKLDEEKLRDFVESKVARHKKLAGGVAVVDSIPKNASGKILRRQLKLAYQERGL